MNDYERFEDTFRAGRKGQSLDAVQDFSVDHVDGSVHVRKLFVQDIGDPGDMGFGRMGPDNAPYDYDQPEEVAAGANLGTWYWRAWRVATGWFGRSAQIYARYRGDGGGSLHFATTRIGETNPIDHLSIGEDGVLSFEDMPIDRVSETYGDQYADIRVMFNGRQGRLRIRFGS